jgi:hypothetical protein
MTRIRLAAALVVAAGLVHVLLTLPAGRARDAARAEFGRQRAERELVRAELARLERRAAARSGAAAPEDDAAAARALRRAMLDATRGLAIDQVQIAALPERQGALAARGRLAGTGSQAELLRAAGRLASPASGVLLQRLELAHTTGGVRLEAEAVSVRGGS